MSFAVICDVVVPHADKSDGSVCRRPFVESPQNDMGTTAMAPVNTAVQHAGQEDRTTMKRHRHTPEQLVRKLREGDRLLNEGRDLAEVLRHLEVSESSWNRWPNQYGGMKANEAKRLRELESENARLKRLLAEAELDKAMLKELSEGNF
jgi:hypothetical protein